MQEHRDIQRIEAFSDGVFAIAATLLILEIKVPQLQDLNLPGALWHSLGQEWPSFVAFTLSFGTILVMWMNHHRALKLLVGSSKTFLFANGFLLLTVTFVPFPTAVLAAYINTPQANIAVMFYSGSYLICNFGFNVWWRSMLRPIYIINSKISQDQISKLSLQTGFGFVIYLVTTILAYWFPEFSLIIIFALFIMWITMSFGDKEIE